MKNISISKEIPEIYYRLKDKFNIDWNDGIIICNGNTLHCKNDIPAEKIVHEVVHSERQESIGLDKWWNEYLESDLFRLEEEILAYRAEYQFLKRHVNNREIVYRFLRQMGELLSGEMYGNIIDLDDAIKQIKK